MADASTDDGMVRVMALHALAYCERLFYLEEDEDDLMFVHLCPACAARVDVRGEERGWGGNRDRFDIL